MFYKVVLYKCYDGKMRLGYASKAWDKIKIAPDAKEGNDGRE